MKKEMYEKSEVTKVDFKFEDGIAASDQCDVKVPAKEMYEKPEVTKVDFKFEDAIAASGQCEWPDPFFADVGEARCLR